MPLILVFFSNEILSYFTLIAVQNAIKLSFLRRDVNILACHLKVIYVLDLIDVLSQGRFWICFHLDQSMILYSRSVFRWRKFFSEATNRRAGNA